MGNFHDQLTSLSVAEKFDLLDEVWQSIEAGDMPLSAEQVNELDYRLTQHELNPENVVPWDQVKAGMPK